jgi:alkylation response protein AidB-like acyl-CoA dehydrogenase
VNLSSELEEFRQAIGAQSRARIGPLAASVDRDQSFSPQMWAALHDMGMFGLPFPESLGGSGGSFLAYVVATEEIARHAAVAALYPGTTVQVARTIIDHGTPTQIEQFVPPLVAGDQVAAWAFTEPGTGSDPRQIATQAERVEGRWRLNGAKAFISYAHVADQALVFARVDERNLGAFLVDTGQPGWKVGGTPKLLSFGGGEASEVILADVDVPDDRVIGDPTRGFDVMLAGEAQGKLRVSAICVGIGQRAVDEAVAYAEARLHRGKPLSERFPTVQALLGDMAAPVLGARALVRDCADLLDRGHAIAKQAAACRLVTARAAQDAAGLALQVCGAYGLTREMAVERLYREAKFYDVAQGVLEIQKIIVARELVAEYRGTRQG